MVRKKCRKGADTVQENTNILTYKIKRYESIYQT